MQEFISQEYASIAIKIGEQIQPKRHTIQEDQQGQNELLLDLHQQDKTKITSNLQSNQQLQVVSELQQGQNRITSNLQVQQHLQMTTQLQSQQYRVIGNNLKTSKK